MNIAASSCADACPATGCRLKCSLEVVDELLATPEAVSGDEADLLLDFRSLLRAHNDAEGTLRLFSDLRRRLEQRHYLAFYRLRRWLENQIKAEVWNEDPGRARQVPLRLEFYCVEAIRRSCLCAALQQEIALPTARLRFIYTSTLYPEVADHAGIFNFANAK